MESGSSRKRKGWSKMKIGVSFFLLLCFWYSHIFFLGLPMSYHHRTAYMKAHIRTHRNTFILIKTYNFGESLTTFFFISWLTHADNETMMKDWSCFHALSVFGWPQRQTPFENCERQRMPTGSWMLMKSAQKPRSSVDRRLNAKIHLMHCH